MIDNILGNRTNILVLRFLIRFKDQFFPIEEIAKETGAGLRNIHDSLRTLTGENLLKIKSTLGRNYYKFQIDTKINELIALLFDEENKRLYFNSINIYKILSEIEAKINNIVGTNLIDIFLFGSVAKGRDTVNSDIDLCVLVERKDQSLLTKLRSLQFDNKFKNEIQIHTFTNKEFIDANKNENPLVKNILRDGLSLKIGK